MSDSREYLQEFINKLQLSEYVPELPNIPNLPELPNLPKLSDLPNLSALDRGVVIKQILGVAKFFNPSNPNFPVAVCTVFILLLGTTVIILRIIWRRLKPAQKSVQDQPKKSATSNEKSSKGPPVPASRWKRQTVTQEKKVEPVVEEERPKSRWKKPAPPPEKPERKKIIFSSKSSSPKPEMKSDSAANSPSLASKLAKGFNILKSLSPKTGRKNESSPKATPKSSPKVVAKMQKDPTPKNSPKLLSRIFGSSSPKPVPKIEVTSASNQDKKNDVKENYEENSKILTNLKKMWSAPSSNSEEKIENQQETKSKPEKMPERVIHLNIDKNARKIEDLKKARDEELLLVRTMGKEFRELAKCTNPEAREERAQEMEKIKSARNYFKTVEKIQKKFDRDNSESRFNIENENLEGTGLSVGDLNIVKRRSNFFQTIEKNNTRLSQFEPGKLNRNFTSVFEGVDRSSQERGRAPKKKLISPEEVLKKEEEEDIERKIRQKEIQELAEARKNWVPPDDSPPVAHPSTTRTNIQVGGSKGSVTKRWLEVQQDDRKEKTQSLEVPGRISVSPVFMGGPKIEDSSPNDIEIEPPKKREQKGGKISERWLQHCKNDSPGQRSRSVNSYHRNKLPDNSWVLEKSEPDDTLRKRALMELEVIKKAREEMNDDKIYDFTNIRAEERRKEALMELETVKSLRKNKPEENIYDFKEDTKAQRKQEIDMVMKMRSSGKEYAVESTPGSKPSGLERSKSSHTVKFKEVTPVDNSPKGKYTKNKVVEETSVKQGKLDSQKSEINSKALTEETDGTPKPEQKHLASCLMDRIKDKTDVKDVLHRSESFFRDKFRSRSTEKKEQKQASSTEQEEEARPKTPSFVEKLKSSKSVEKLKEIVGGSHDETPAVDPDTNSDSTLIGRMRGRSMERKADIYAKIKETREIVQNTEKALVETFENTEKVLIEKFEHIRSKSQEAKKKVMWNEADAEAIEAARSEIIKTEVNNSGMYKILSLEREKSKSKERKTSKSNSSEKANKDPKKIEKSSSSESKLNEKKVKKSGSTEIKEAVIKSKSNEKVAIKTSEDGEAKAKKSSVFSKAFSAMEEKATEVKNVASKYNESKSCSATKETCTVVNHEIEENTKAEIVKPNKADVEELYSKVNKKKDKNESKEKKTENTKPDLIPSSVKMAKDPVPAKSFIKPGEDHNKIDLDNLKGYKIEKCNLKSTDVTKILPTRVANCTPRPFTPFSGGSALSNSPSFSTPSASPMPSFTSSPLPPADNATVTPAVFSNNPVTPSPVAFTSIPEPTVKRPTPQLSPKFMEQKVEEVNQEKEHSAVVGSAFTKFVDSVQFPTVFNRHSAHENEEQTFVATVENSSTNNLEKKTDTLEKKVSAKAEKFAKYIQKKTEKESKTASPSVPLTMNEVTRILSGEQSTSIMHDSNHIYSTVEETTSEAVNILTADLPDVANVKEKGSVDKMDENGIMTRFKEFKTKTISEVSKLTRSRSVQKKGTMTIRRESTESESKLDRTRSESRTQKAGKMMKDFTSNILKRR